MENIISLKEKNDNFDQYCSEKDFNSIELKMKISSLAGNNFTFIGGSILYGIQNLYSDIDVIILVENEDQEIPAQLSQFDFKGVRIDCRIFTLTKIEEFIDNINEKAKIVSKGKNPFRLGLKNELLEVLDRIKNGIKIDSKILNLPCYDMSLPLLLSYDRQNDFFGMYQDCVGALHSKQYQYATSRTIECGAKIVDIFMALNGYINPSVKSRLLVLEKYFKDDEVSEWYKKFLENTSAYSNSYKDLDHSLREMSKLSIKLQRQKADLIEKYRCIYE